MVVTLKSALKNSANVDGIVNNGATPHLLEDTVWEDLRFPVTQTRVNPGTIKPDFNVVDITLDFDDTTDEFIYINAQMPHSWKAGSVIYPHCHWFQNQNTNVGWYIDYRWQINGDAKTTSWTTLALDQQAFTYTSGTLDQINFTAAGITCSGCDLSDILQIIFYRDVSADTYVGDAQLMQVDIHYQIDTLGSQDEYIK